MNEHLFDEPSILASFDDIAAHLEQSDAPTGLLIVVGGSFMALHGLRESTHDIDTVNRISDTIRAAADEVARARGFEPDWLNDRAAGFAPVGLDEAERELLYEHPRLRVLGPPADYVFLMKLYAARGGPDHNDMVHFGHAARSPQQKMQPRDSPPPTRTRGATLTSLRTSPRSKPKPR